jgi:hypothetical protein
MCSSSSSKPSADIQQSMQHYVPNERTLYPKILFSPLALFWKKKKKDSYLITLLSVCPHLSARIVEAEEMTAATQRLGKHISMATNISTTE